MQNFVKGITLYKLTSLFKFVIMTGRDAIKMKKNANFNIAV